MLLFLPYLHTQLVVAQAARSQKQDGSKGRDGAEQAEESGSQGWTHGFPPLSDMRDVKDAGGGPLGFNKDLHSMERSKCGGHINKHRS